MVFSDLLDYAYTPVTNASCYVPDTTFDIAFGILLGIGVWVSWLPQQIEFAYRRSTFGVSSLYVILTQVANWTPFINALYLDHDTFKCCTYISFWECQESLIAIYQLGISVFSVVCIHILYVIYYTPTVPEVIEDELGFTEEEEVSVQMREAHFGVNAVDEDEVQRNPELESAAEASSTHKELVVKLARRQQVLLFFCFNVVVIVSIAMGFLFMWATYPYSPIVVWYSYGLSAIGVLAVLFQFTPQIYLTYKIKERGSLSLVMLLIQTPGTWIWLAYLVADGQNWSTWISTLVAAVEVSILLCQVLWYDCLRKRFAAKAVAISEDDKPLLSEQYDAWQD